ncbi:MAG: restriction endonuclease subunit S [Clostridia bacterium]|nr:restriction endonuclease subunit S [Clostridia bacterium]
MREMKDSGVNWCQTIPSNWSIIPSKYLFRDSNVRRFDGDVQLTASQKYGIISQVDYMEREQVSIVLANKGLESWKHVEPLDFIISLRSFQGGLEMSEVKGCITWHYVVLKATQTIHHGYYKWLFKSAQYITALQRTCNFIRDGQDLRYSNFAKVPLPYPSVEEQQAIACYLDSKCSEIDALMEDIQAEISTLEEYKKSIICEAVTKGLNPDAELKDSGMAWVGKCPGHWETAKFKYHFKRRTVKNPGDAPVLSLYREYGVIPKDSREDNHNVTSEDTSKYLFVRNGDFVINKMKAWQGSVAVSELEGIVSPAYYVYEFIGSALHRKYIHYFMRNKSLAAEFRRLSGGIREGQWDLAAASLENCIICIPPLREQQGIADYLDTKCSEIDSTIAEKKKQLTTLEEYKKSLIYEYVTGKKEVPTL